MFSISNAALARNEPTIRLNVNGFTQIDQAPVIIDQTTLVPIRAVSLLPIFKVDWDNKTKTVSVTNTASNEVLKLTLEKKTAYKGNTQLTINVPPRNVNGSIYVPFRFIAESLDAYVAWDAATKTVVIYSAPENKDTENKDLATARQAVLALPMISLHDSLGYTPDIRTTEYYFPYGQSKKFYIMNGEYIRYYEVRNHAAWQVWEGRIAAKKPNDPDAIPNLVPAVGEEWGERPTEVGSYAYYDHAWMAGVIFYGTIGEDGTVNELGRADGYDDIKIVPIEGESRID
jgi:Copper amine oxidase N-terminal domain.